MSEVVFPLLGTAYVVLVVLPLCAALAKLALVVLEREELAGPLHGLGLRYIVLVGSTVLPLCWFVSAGMHQAEAGTSVFVCLLDHETTARCFEPGLFALTMLVVMSTLGYRRLRHLDETAPSTGCLSCVTTRRHERLADRLRAIVRARPELIGLRDRVHATTKEGFAIGTTGLFRPAVYVGVDFAAKAPDEVLAGALAHELEHVRSLDPLRYWVLELALAFNPLGRALLEPHVARWYNAREAHCDRAAVTHGCAPLALAQAIVQAARPRPAQVAGLGARDLKMLEFRVSMLLAFTERAPTPCCRHEASAMPIAIVLFILALLLPHQTSTAALDVLHVGAEHVLAPLWR